MLIGEYIHSIDEKNRVSFPVKFRKEMGRTVIVTRGFDNCLFVFTVKEWARTVEKFSESSMLHSDTRSFGRYLLGGAVEAAVDSQGRILVPDFLKDRAGLKGKIAIVGVHTRVELWDESVWKEYKERIEKDADALAERLGSIGVL